MINLPHPKVSVITPAYNAAKLIGRTIQSVIDQTFTDWELIIVDDGSTDHTREAVQPWIEQDARIRLIQVKKNFGGPAGPRNLGIESARGECVAFLDADDIWHPQKLSIQIEVLDGDSCDFVCSQMNDFSSEESVRFSDLTSYELETVSFAQQSIRARIPTSSVIVRQELMKRYPFEESISYKAVEDYHCWLRILESSPKCLKVRLPLLYYRKVEGQISGSKWYMMRKVFMVHRNYPGRSLFSAVFFTFSHVTGGLYHRYFKKGM